MYTPRFNDWQKGLGMTTTPRVNGHALSRIGFRLFGTDTSAAAAREDIEATLLSLIKNLPDEYRLASVLLSWVKVHGNYVIVEKMMKRVRKESPDSALSRWMVLVAAWAVECGYHKWKKLGAPLAGPIYFYAPEVSEAAIARKGAIPWLESVGFRVPRDSFRIRESDVLSPEELIAINRQYRNRYLYGASWRADIITAIQDGISSPAEISRVTGCSYEPAYRISQEYRMVEKG